MCELCRALIPATSIKAIDASPKTLNLKRTVGFMKACKELSRHQDLLQHAMTMVNDDDNQSGDNDLDDEQVARDVSMSYNWYLHPSSADCRFFVVIARELSQML
jgi:CO dehydrogenase nickel-insertion accessory protein CooC1